VHGILIYEKLLFLIDSISVANGRITLNGTCVNPEDGLPEGDNVEWTWRGTDNSVICKNISDNVFYHLQVSKGNKLNIIQPIEIR
jgi:hypothetical protein